MLNKIVLFTVAVVIGSYGCGKDEEERKELVGYAEKLAALSNSNGDVNLDNSIDVLDIVSIVNAIVGSDSLNEQEQCSADINEDSSIDVLDIVLIVSIILN